MDFDRFLDLTSVWFIFAIMLFIIPISIAGEPVDAITLISITIFIGFIWVLYAIDKVRHAIEQRGSV